MLPDKHAGGKSPEDVEKVGKSPPAAWIAGLGVVSGPAVIIMPSLLDWRTSCVAPSPRCAKGLGLRQNGFCLQYTHVAPRLTWAALEAMKALPCTNRMFWGLSTIAAHSTCENSCDPDDTPHRHNSPRLWLQQQ